jgi:hypothetical protein
MHPKTLAKQRAPLQQGALSERLSKMPLGCTGYPDDLAKVVLFMAFDLTSYVGGIADYAAASPWQV